MTVPLQATIARGSQAPRSTNSRNAVFFFFFFSFFFSIVQSTPPLIRKFSQVARPGMPSGPNLVACQIFNSKKMTEQQPKDEV